MILGIRPEHILIDDKGKGEPSLMIPCKVELTEPMGAETYLYLIANGHILVARVDPSVRVEVDQSVTAHIPLAKFHLFRESDTARVSRLDEK
ncbi:MAG: TOBE domain-containing protein [Candidatus Riflebacteria bacterium]|nr:TOBE domain-containing protein [Candidatus Riflebacteria bacterium]